MQMYKYAKTEICNTERKMNKVTKTPYSRNKKCDDKNV